MNSHGRLTHKIPSEEKEGEDLTVVFENLMLRCGNFFHLDKRVGRFLLTLAVERRMGVRDRKTNKLVSDCPIPKKEQKEDFMKFFK